MNQGSYDSKGRIVKSGGVEGLETVASTPGRKTELPSLSQLSQECSEHELQGTSYLAPTLGFHTKILDIKESFLCYSLKISGS